jgi:hypothetical protein
MTQVVDIRCGYPFSHRCAIHPLHRFVGFRFLAAIPRLIDLAQFFNNAYLASAMHAPLPNCQDMSSEGFSSRNDNMTSPCVVAFNHANFSLSLLSFAYPNNHVFGRVTSCAGPVLRSAYEDDAGCGRTVSLIQRATREDSAWTPILPRALTTGSQAAPPQSEGRART